MPSMSAAKVAGVHWHTFSETMPWVLCMATAKLSSNQMRHYTIQSAFEELGMRDEKEIHPDLFLKAALAAGVTGQDHLRLSKDRGMQKAVSYLKRAVTKLKADAEILGFLLGLEILAQENIEILFACLSHKDELSDNLLNTRFFQIHKVVEVEHIRLAVSNFLRFCPTEKEQREFTKGCDKGLKFWTMFWSSLGKLAQKEARNV